MKAQRPVSARPAAAELHAEFLQLQPYIERHARIRFRFRNPTEREEAIAEAVAAAFVSYRALKARGKNPLHDFPSHMAKFGALHVLNQRQVGSRSSTKDVLASQAQRKHGFRVQVLPLSKRVSPETLFGSVRAQRHLDAIEERLQDNTAWPIPDQVAFKLDFRAFLGTLPERERRMAEALAGGYRASEVARRLGLSAGRVTQLRRSWRRAWLAAQDEAANGEATTCGLNWTVPATRRTLSRR